MLAAAECPQDRDDSGDLGSGYDKSPAGEPGAGGSTGPGVFPQVAGTGSCWSADVGKSGSARPEFGFGKITIEGDQLEPGEQDLRALAAARAVAASAVGRTRYPMLWRQAALAVELCQRVAEIAGQELPGVLPARQQGGQRRPAVTTGVLSVLRPLLVVLFGASRSRNARTLNP